MVPSVAQLAEIGGGAGTAANESSVVIALQTYGAAAGLDKPHRLAQFLGQLAHESGGFKYDREVWGPTPAQARYDTRVDLGNTPAVDGDGKKNAGKGPIQITGGANIRAFYNWCVRKGYKPPDFVANPDLINSDPWEGLSAIWFWDSHKLNTFADQGDVETITKRINGGLNGFDSRIKFLVRASLVLLGFAPTDVRGFQIWAQGKKLIPADVAGKPTQIDNDPGPKTRSALHMALVALDTTGEAADVAVAAPVMSESPVEVPVVPKGADKPGLARWFTGFSFVGLFGFLADVPTWAKIGFGVLVVVGILALYLRGEQIAARVKSVLKSFES